MCSKKQEEIPMTSTGNKVSGVGIIGAGRVSRDHVYAIKNIPGLQLIGIADPDEARRTSFAHQHQCDAYADYRQLLARDDIDLILAGVPHWLHAPISLAALNAGKHVMVEKPMAMTIAEGEAMIETADKNGVQLMVGHTQHFFTANIAAKQLIDSGKIGAIVFATQMWYKPFGLPTRQPWMLDRAKGGGMLFMNGAHMVDCLLWFIGSELVAVKGSVTNTIVGQKADDSVIALLQFANGVYATVVHSCSKHPEHPPEQWLTGEIIGAEGRVKTIPYQGKAWLNTEDEYEPIELEKEAAKEKDIAAFVNTITGTPIDAPVAQSIIEEISGVTNEVAAFVTAIESGTEPPISNVHALAVIKALLAIEESARTGREARLR
jgi:predicted dehydrogenase